MEIRASQGRCAFFAALLVVWIAGSGATAATSARSSPAHEARSLPPPISLGEFEPIRSFDEGSPLPEDRDAPSMEGRFRHDLSTALDGSSTGIASNGRIHQGDAWSLEWSSSLAYEGGPVIGERDAPAGDFHVSHLSLERRVGERGRLRGGRFSSPSVALAGTIDGAQGEMEWGRALRIGALAGVPVDAGGDLHHSVAAAYVATELGREGRLYHRSTVGLFGSLYEGAPDRLAVVVTQRTDVTSKLRVLCNSEIDLGTFDGDERRSGLTAVSIETVSPVTSRLTLRVGLDHRKTPDTRSSRDALPSESERAFSRGNSRYWLGGEYALPGRVLLESSWSVLDAQDRDELESLWRVGVRRRGLPLLPRASIGATLTNLDGYADFGYGVELDAHLPLEVWPLDLGPRLAFRIADPELGPDVAVTDLGLRARLRGRGAFSLDLAVNYSFAERDERVVFELGMRFVW